MVVPVTISMMLVSKLTGKQAAVQNRQASLCAGGNYINQGSVGGPSVKAMRHKSSKIVTAIPDAKESLTASHTVQILRGFSSIAKKTGKLTQK